MAAVAAASFVAALANSRRRWSISHGVSRLGEEVFAAGRACRFRRRATRELLASPLFGDFYAAIQHHRSPSLADLRHAARPRDCWTDALFRSVEPALGYAIRLQSGAPQ